MRIYMVIHRLLHYLQETEVEVSIESNKIKCRLSSGGRTKVVVVATLYC